MTHKFPDEFTATRPLVLVGCGSMGAALLRGWLEKGLDASAMHSVDPNLDPLVPHKLAGVHRDPGIFFQICEEKGLSPRVVVLAVKPQYMAEVTEAYRDRLPEDCLVLSVAAGLTSTFYRQVFGPKQPLVRVMPNTPASVGLGVSLLCDLGATKEADIEVASRLMSSVGKVCWVDEECKIDTLTSVTGSGPAYVFLLIEALTAAALDQGMKDQDAQEMATQVVLGAATLASQSDKSAEILRQNVTSPGGVTQAALDILMTPETGLSNLIVKGCRAGTRRAFELGDNNE